MKLDASDMPEIVEQLDSLALGKGYSKIFAKVPGDRIPEFRAAGYRLEAMVPGFFAGQEDGAFVGKYFSAEREAEPNAEVIQKNLHIARNKAEASSDLDVPGDVAIDLTTQRDAEQMAEIYKVVFASYPFPIHDPEYLRQTMRANVRYFCARVAGKMVALCSAEMDQSASAVEMTDFATLPSHRGRGLAAVLLHQMEADPVVSKLHMAYTIARALSPGMNVTFAKLGYSFAGTLIRNTDISGKIESMNVWYKTMNAAEGASAG